MKAHPYLRAYMAGIVTPTVFLAFVFVFFCVARFGYKVDYPVERVIVFPLAIVPNLWGLWNMLWVLLHQGRRWPLGLHGAVVPVFALPLSAWAADMLGFVFPVPMATIVAIGLPGLAVIYYLLWKYIVGFLNDLLGVG